MLISNLASPENIEYAGNFSSIMALIFTIIITFIQGQINSKLIVVNDLKAQLNQVITDNSNLQVMIHELNQTTSQINARISTMTVSSGINNNSNDGDISGNSRVGSTIIVQPPEQ